MTHILNHPEQVTYYIANTDNVYSYGVVNTDQCMETGLVNVTYYSDYEEFTDRLYELGINDGGI